MSIPDTPSDGFSSEDDFERALNELIRTALANDINVRGGWSVNQLDGSHELGVEIYRVAR